MSGSVCSEPLIRKVYSDLNMHGLCIVYGMTELSPVATLMGPDSPFDKKISTVGHIGPQAEIKIIDEQGKIVPVGEKGEVCVRGYLTMQRYWEDPENTSETKTDGWIRSGDLGFLDADGYLSISGRLKDLIIRGGENISPREIEDLFDKQKWIKDIQVIGVKDEIFGEEVVAWIIPDREITDPNEMISELLKLANEKLAYYKIPRYIYVSDYFPMTANGKV